MKNKSNNKSLAIMWFIFGCVFVVFSLIDNGATLGKSLTSLTSFLLFITAWIYWKNAKKK